MNPDARDRLERNHQMSRSVANRLDFTRCGDYRRRMLPDQEVLILGLNYPPEPTGIAPYTGSLAAGLRNHGLAVTALVAHPHYPEWQIREGYGKWTQDEDLDGVHVRRHLHYVPRSPRGLRRLLSELTFGIRLSLARWNRPDAVVAISPSLFSTAIALIRHRLMRGRPPLVVWVQDIYSLGIAETGEGNRLVQWLVTWVEARTFRAADRVVVIHDRFADFVIKQLGVLDSRVVVVRNWTHLAPSARIDAVEAKANLGWPTGVTLAVHTGNMGAKQGLENIVEAARIAELSDSPVQFILVGDGGEREMLEVQAHGLKRLTFVDPLDDTEYRDALAAADVLLVNEKPGVSAMAVPSKLTSYFDAEKPVIAATDPSGITASEIVAADAGLVIPAGNPTELLKAIETIAGDPALAARYGANGRKYREAVLDKGPAIQVWRALIENLCAAAAEEPTV